jgi:hypothetical protein
MGIFARLYIRTSAAGVGALLVGAPVAAGAYLFAETYGPGVDFSEAIAASFFGAFLGTGLAFLLGLVAVLGYGAPLWVLAVQRGFGPKVSALAVGAAPGVAFSVSGSASLPASLFVGGVVTAVAALCLLWLFSVDIRVRAANQSFKPTSLRDAA